MPSTVCMLDKSRENNNTNAFHYRQSVWKYPLIAITCIDNNQNGCIL